MKVLMPSALKYGTQNTTRMDLENIYVITANQNGEPVNPNKADKVAFYTDKHIMRAINVVKAKPVTEFLGSKDNSLWLLNNTHAATVPCSQWDDGLPLWERFEGFDPKNPDALKDYDVDRLHNLQKRYETEFPWSTAIKNKVLLSNLLGVAPSTFIQLSHSITVDSDKFPTVKLTSSALDYWEQVLQEYKGEAISASTIEQPNPALIERYQELGDKGEDDDGYIYEMRTFDGGHQRLTKFNEVLVRHKNKARTVMLEKNRYPITSTNARVKLDGDWVYFTYNAMTSSSVMVKVLMKLFPEELKPHHEFAEELAKGAAPTLLHLHSAVKKSDMEPEAYYSMLASVTFEQLGADLQWHEMNLVDLSPMQKTLALAVEHAKTNTPRSSYLNKLPQLERLVKERYGLLQFYPYVRPLAYKLSAAVESKPSYYAWMMFCEQRKPDFEYDN